MSDKLRQRCVFLAQGVVLGQLIGQARDVRQQVLHRHGISAVSGELRKELLHRIVELELATVEKSHERRDGDRFRNRPEQEHRVLVMSRAERPRL